MLKQSIIQRALGRSWDDLPHSLKQHYHFATNEDVGSLTIEYPRFMQLPLNFLKLFGALINRQGQDIETRVKKDVRNQKQYWQRTLTFADGSQTVFNSRWEYTNNNEIIEFVNPFLGLRMAVTVSNKELHYQGINYVLRMGWLQISIPEWMLLGHTSIVESAISEDSFQMNFRLTHPLLGQIFCYRGRFKTVVTDESM